MWCGECGDPLRGVGDDATQRPEAGSVPPVHWEVPLSATLHHHLPLGGPGPCWHHRFLHGAGVCVCVCVCVC
ncbi:hypothetical protein E2C01_099519 [Portunus trituberculatus]|uniref:Uncharacterized protein n=1 Tax=Portunus trituberculatus TaxID=210409 RepID=A0A5B7K5P6_PORTR|nr:hypothetical protein [Portunus trituberculatus]